MCSIIASFNKDTCKELIKLNSHRGNFSYSVSDYNYTYKKYSYIKKGFGELPLNKIDDFKHYIICHIQAPTGGLIEDLNRIHPTRINNSYLYHNGLLTRNGIKYIQNELNVDDEFDTLLLHKYIMEKGLKSLSNVEGLFSCLLIYYDNIYIFRTKHGKLFVDNNLNISSERFNNSKCINYNTIYELDFENKELIDTSIKFKTKKFNYLIPGEL